MARRSAAGERAPARAGVASRVSSARAVLAAPLQRNSRRRARAITRSPDAWARSARNAVLAAVTADTESRAALRARTMAVSGCWAAAAAQRLARSVITD